MKDIAELREFAEESLSPELASYLVDALLEPGHPEFGADWGDFVFHSARWLLAHARWRINTLGAKVQVSLHGRGVRIEPGDIFCTDMEEFDCVLEKLIP